MGLLDKIFGTYSEKEVKRIKPIVEKINNLEPEIEKLSDSELKAKTEFFKQELQNGKTLDDILPEAFAVVREASKRVLGMRHFDVQLIGGIVLHQGRIAEMKTGEGKTLVGTLPVYLNALTGLGVHVVTVNEYLARRDSEWMGKLYKFLGLTVGLVYSGMDPKEKRLAYKSDVTYGTNSEFGFDFLRDNMAISKEALLQRKLNYVIIDEIDSILIDEARTPLIISGRGAKSSDLYQKADAFVRKLTPKVVVETDVKDEEQTEDIEKYDYVVDLKARTASLTLKGTEKAEKAFGIENLNDISNVDLVSNIKQALQAHGVMKKDIDYIVQDGKVEIVDEFTGRILHGRRYSNGLHQAIEAKEHVKIEDEYKTLATITYQNLFRLYDKISGMTGTAMTEETEFREIYGLDVIEIPTNKPIARIDNIDVVYKNQTAKFNAVIEEIKEAHEMGQPVLVGTVSIEKSEILSNMLAKTGIPHNVLNAKNHQKEAEIIAQAGKAGAVTIATNMAGRGTDIMLGGNSEYLAKQCMRKEQFTEDLIEEATSHNETDNEDILNARKRFADLVKQYDDEIREEKEKVIAAGGLRIIGTERHESRRIDNQLRGRAGRQGDPGQTRFYLGLDDDLLKIFGGEMITNLLTRGNVPEDMPIEFGILSKTIETAQRRIEGIHFQSRKNVLNYDDVINGQRLVIYDQRKSVLDGEDVSDTIREMIEDSVDMIVDTYAEDLENGNADLLAFRNELKTSLNISSYFDEFDDKKINVRKLSNSIKEMAIRIYEDKVSKIGDSLKVFERVILLKIVDSKWMDHIDEMDDLKKGIGLRAYAQKDPVVQYRIEGGEMFDEMISQIKLDVAKVILHLEHPSMNPDMNQNNVKITSEGLDLSAMNNNGTTNSEMPKTNVAEKKQPVVNNGPKVGRNDPCPCGSGLKYKKCCGKEA